MAFAFDAEYLLARRAEQKVWILANPSQLPRISSSAALLSLPQGRGPRHPRLIRDADQIPFIAGSAASGDSIEDPWSFDGSENVLDPPKPILKRPSTIFRRREPEPADNEEPPQARCLPVVRFLRRIIGRAWKGYKRVAICGVPIRHRPRFPPDGAELDMTICEDSCHSKIGRGMIQKLPDSPVLISNGSDDENRKIQKRKDRRVRFAEPLPHFTPSSSSRRKRSKKGHKTLIVTNDFSILYVNHVRKFPRRKNFFNAL